ncbi:MAG: hypothetical protein RMH93_07090 [Aquificaceae bacterium]|nr:hypothetical protein [Aquificaceae bacterium]
MRATLLLITLPYIAFAFYPFNAEDTGTLGGLGRFQLEFNLAHFRYYDKTRHQDALLQLTAGIREDMDLAMLIPYSSYKYQNGSKIEGINDLGVFIKHIPLKPGEYSIGYKLQLNLDTGKRGIGYQKTTANLNLIVERKLGRATLNMNLVYTKTSQIEELRDSYGIYLHAYGDVKPWITAGVEFKYLIPQERSVGKRDMHALFGVVFHPSKDVDISLGLHKSLNRHESFANYGVLAGVLWRF